MEVVRSPDYRGPRKHSVTISDHHTSVSLEPAFWTILSDYAAQRGVSVNALVADIDAARMRAPAPPNLASAIRLWVLAQVTTS